MPLPLVAIPSPKRRSLFDAALEARRALCVLEAPGAAPSEIETSAARHRVLVQLASVAQCLEEMAETGLLHTGLNSQRTMQTSAHQSESDGEWTAETIVTRVPSRPMIAAKWSTELCRAAMLGSVVLDVVSRDHRRELVEYRELAAVLVDAWPNPDPRLAERFVDEWEHWEHWERGLDYRCSGPVDASPWGKAVHQVHAQLTARACDCFPPPEVAAGAIHALDFARRTLQWAVSSPESLGEDAEA